MDLSSLPAEAFRVHPGDGAEMYFRVTLAPTAEEMRVRMRTISAAVSDQIIASCCSLSADDDPYLVGVLFFCEEWMGAGIVAHEMGHAAFRAMEASGRNVGHGTYPATEAEAACHTDQPVLCEQSEETYCEALECLVKEFWRAYYDLHASDDAVRSA